MTRLHEAVDEYLAMRRALGYKLAHHAPLLHRFVDDVERSGEDHITVEVALAWATSPTGTQRVWWVQRLGIVRGFARHLAMIDPANEIPPEGLVTHHASRRTPYLYSATDVAALMSAARALRAPIQAATFETLVGLLAVTGLRVGEAVGLDRSDVDLIDGTITVREGKFGKSRWLPLHKSVVTALVRYSKKRDELCPHPRGESFFISCTGTRLSAVNAVFRSLVRAAGLEHAGEHRPCPHDLRHSFATETLIEWHASGIDVEARLLSLSTYLGHVKPSSTYWYLQATPELLSLAARRLERGGPR